MDLIQFSQKRDVWLADVNTATNILILEITGNFLTS